VKYYIYISDTKVDMLYPQIPKPVLKRIASSLSIDLKLLGAELSVGIKNNQVDETRYAKVRIVSEYIEKHLDVGSIDAPSTYFKGKLFMKQGTLLNQAVISESKQIYNITSTKDDIENEMQQDTLMGIVYITRGRPSHIQQFEFLAKTLLQGSCYTNDYVVLGTPIYVAIAD